MKYISLEKSKSNNEDETKLNDKKKKNLKMKVFKLIIMFISIIFLFFISDIISFFSLEKTHSVPFNETEALNEILSFEKNLNLTNNIFYDFLRINEQNKLIEENIKFEKSKKPIVSVVMLVHSQSHYLQKCLRSIQNQSLKNIEIIIVDDCSLDNSVELIKEYQKEDPRIILIEHDANEGMIKTRTDGVRKAKGKYIASIDGDDTFIHKDILKNSVYIAEKGNLDIVDFPKYVYYDRELKRKEYEFPYLNLSYILHQPELRTKFLRNNSNSFNLVNEQIIGKLIKTKLYKNTIKYVGEEYTEDYINDGEDRIFVIGFFHLANSYYLMKEVGYLYFEKKRVQYTPKEKSRVCKVVDKLKGFDEYKYIRYITEKAGNNSKEQIFAYRKIMSLNILYLIYNTELNERQLDVLVKILDAFLTNKYFKNSKKSYMMELKTKVLKRKKK